MGVVDKKSATCTAKSSSEIRQVLTFAVKNCILTQGNYECAVDIIL